MSDQTIHIEEELEGAAEDVKAASKRWSEEISVRGGDLKETVGRLAKEATVRKIIVKSQSGKKLFEFPLVLGAAGVLIMGSWTAVLLAAAWLARVSILIEYEEAPSKVEEAVSETARQIEAAVA